MQQRWHACYSRPPVRNREVLFDFCGPKGINPVKFTGTCVACMGMIVWTVSARWVPKNLTDDHKGQRMMASLDHLTRYTARGHDFLEGIVTGDESWAYNYTPETKQASAVRRWLHSNQTDFYEQGILKLVTRWEKCVEKVGDYVEK
ncbi:hypothetical protein L9F63_002074 [Diploptera punctata]|uniref:Uncharacterized protein n=1 Tax=Diploptera punctata TaxID=6984 RepID=A0AAD8A327_DIPPU|nr:hypothetical protein L9F63_002074 [Diploptera punctata]